MRGIQGSAEANIVIVNTYTDLEISATEDFPLLPTFLSGGTWAVYLECFITKHNIICTSK